MTNTFVTKDSGKRKDFASGMRRDVEDGKMRYDLIYWPYFLDVYWYFTPENEVDACHNKNYEELSLELLGLLTSDLSAKGLDWESHQISLQRILANILNNESIDIHTFTTRLAGLMTRGAEKYGDNNWQKANSKEELARFQRSAMRHYFQFHDLDLEEDHLSAVGFNLGAIYYLLGKLHGKQ